MKDQKKDVRKNPEMEDAREFVEMYKKLTPDDRKQVRGIMIGIQIGKQQEREAVNA